MALLQRTNQRTFITHGLSWPSEAVTRLEDEVATARRVRAEPAERTATVLHRWRAHRRRRRRRRRCLRAFALGPRVRARSAARFSFLRSFSTKGSQALLGQQNSLVSLDSYAFPTHEKSVTLSAATTRSKMAAMKLQASEGDGDEDALSPV